MQIYGKCLVVVADGENARLFEEGHRGGPLAERPAWTEDLTPTATTAHAKGRVFERFGPGSHTIDAMRPKDRSEARFLENLAERVDKLVVSEGFEDVIVIAPPRALGVLRSALPPATLKRLGASEAAERCGETPDALRNVVRRLRGQA